MKVLVTGNRGYIGCHLVRLLKEYGHYVTGVDLNIFQGCNLEELPEPDKQIVKDYRDLNYKELEGHDCVIHLAAISNDPMGEIDKNVTFDVNYQGSVRLAEKAKFVGIPRFLFSSSCSIYGKGIKLDLDEDDQLNPITAYAESKIKSEQDIKKLADNNFSPCFLRNATAYGYSEMLRIDLVANDFLACAMTKNEIRIKSNGEPWRPLIHVKDIARAFLKFLEAPREKIHNISVNIGSNEENYQVKEIANKVKVLINNSKIVFTGEIGEDPRNYRVKFDYLYSIFPDFYLEYNLEKGLFELYNKLLIHKFSLFDYESQKFIRLRVLKDKISLLKR